jgi:hypothetical protein
MARSRILIACALWAALPALSLAQRPSVDPVPVGDVTDKLGVKTMVNAPRELDLGHSVTTTLADPKKLVAYGIKGMHEGARVTITCVGPNRVRVEAEEMEPVEQRTTVTLRLGEDGSLTPVPPSPPKPDKPPTA